jgi:hypothetical protein
MKTKHIDYRELSAKVTNITKGVHQFTRDKDYTISIYCHSKSDHYLGLLMMWTFLLLKRSSLIVTSPEEADVAVLLFKNGGAAKEILGRNPGVLLASLYDCTQDAIDSPTLVFPWEEELKDYGG